MFTQRTLNRFRAAIAILLLSCTTSQAAKTLQGHLPDPLYFMANATTANYVQLATAALTMPTGIIAAAHPDNNQLKLVDHSLKLLNEALAACLQQSPYSASWACFDAIQTTKALVNLLSDDEIEQPNATTPTIANVQAAEDMADATVTTPKTAVINTQEDGTPIDNQQWQTFVHYANYVLASAEAVTRVAAALEIKDSPNNAYLCMMYPSAQRYLMQRSEFYHGLTSLIRLTRYCLQDSTKKLPVIMLVLVIANALITIFQYREVVEREDFLSKHPDFNRTTQQPQSLLGQAMQLNQTIGQATSNPTATLADLQRRRPYTNTPSHLRRLNINDHVACIMLFRRDQEAKPENAQIELTPANVNIWCQEHNIEPFPTH